MPQATPIEIITTADGSNTLFVPELNEHYHSTFGALQESLHIFIETGLQFIASRFNEINILEIGMGTGLNVLLTFAFAKKQNLKVNYVAYEPFPLSTETAGKLNYLNFPELSGLQDEYRLIHSPCASTKEIIHINDGFILEKRIEKIESARLETEKYHLVYFDAFGPAVQPVLWEKEKFAKIYLSMAAGGVLVTYSAKGSVKRALKECNFQLEILPGPPGKRHMTRAIKNY